MSRFKDLNVVKKGVKSTRKIRKNQTFIDFNEKEQVKSLTINGNATLDVENGHVTLNLNDKPNEVVTDYKPNHFKFLYMNGNYGYYHDGLNERLVSAISPDFNNPVFLNEMIEDPNFKDKVLKTINGYELGLFKSSTNHIVAFRPRMRDSEISPSVFSGSMQHNYIKETLEHYDYNYIPVFAFKMNNDKVESINVSTIYYTQKNNIGQYKNMIQPSEFLKLKTDEDKERNKLIEIERVSKAIIEVYDSNDSYVSTHELNKTSNISKVDLLGDYTNANITRIDLAYGFNNATLKSSYNANELTDYIKIYTDISTETEMLPESQPPRPS